MNSPVEPGAAAGFGLLDFDHAVVGVGNLDGAVARFERLGFTVAPVRQREEGGPPRATDSRHLLFAPAGVADVANFVAIQSVVRPTAIPDELARIFAFLGDSEGLKGLVAYAPDVERTMELMRADGIPTNDALAHSEGWWRDEATGADIPIVVRQLAALTRRMPFAVNAFWTEAVENWRHPTWTAHPNTARRFAGATGVSASAATDAARMSDILGVPVREEETGHFTVTPRDIALRILTPEAFERRFPGLDRSTEQLLPGFVALEFEVESISAVTAILTASDVPFQRSDEGRVMVPRRFANNVIIEFSQPALD